MFSGFLKTVGSSQQQDYKYPMLMKCIRGLPLKSAVFTVHRSCRPLRPARLPSARPDLMHTINCKFNVGSTLYQIIKSDYQSGNRDLDQGVYGSNRRKVSIRLGGLTNYNAIDKTSLGWNRMISSVIK